MSPRFEKRLLQVAMACALPLSVVVALRTIAEGPGFLARVPVPVDLDSHVRYLSGIFLVMLAAFASCIPGVERKGPRIRLLGAMVIVGGLARAWAAVDVGLPTTGHQIGLALELVVTPALLLWQARVARRYG
jgi:hypothetical protein